MKLVACMRLIVATMFAMGALCPVQAGAQVPARFYWKGLTGANAIPLIFNSVSGNTNPFDPAHTVTPGSSVDATIAIAGYAHTYSLFDRSAMAAILLPMGHISGEITAAGRAFNQSASGFGDPMLEFNLNLIEAGRLTAELSGSALLQVEKEIKEVTFHNLSIRRSERGPEVSVVFDV